MINDIEITIAAKSQELFYAYGYQRVTMRQIARACGVSVGNLTYYYPHKEDLLMLLHDEILNSFLEKVLTGDNDLVGLSGYFTVECAFLHKILNHKSLAPLYAEVINIPTLRTRYCRAHHKLFQHFMGAVPDGGQEWIATVAMSALEFELADEGIIMDDFPTVMESIFRTRLLFAGKAPEDFAADIREGIIEGIKISVSQGS